MEIKGKLSTNQMLCKIDFEHILALSEDVMTLKHKDLKGEKREEVKVRVLQNLTYFINRLNKKIGRLQSRLSAATPENKEVFLRKYNANVELERTLYHVRGYVEVAEKDELMDERILKLLSLMVKMCSDGFQNDKLWLDEGELTESQVQDIKKSVSAKRDEILSMLGESVDTPEA